MERHRWETAIRCLEIAVHPNTGDDEVIAAVNGFRRTTDGLPLSQVCTEFARGVPRPAELAQMKDALDQLQRENRELRRQLTVEKAAQAEAAQRIETAYRRIYELTEEAARAQRQAEAAEREFEDFRAAYAEVLRGVQHNDFARRWGLDEAGAGIADKPSAIKPSTAPRQPFSAFLAEARLAMGRATDGAASGNTDNSRVAANDPGGEHPWTA
jgi:hypothetical protein